MLSGTVCVCDWLLVVTSYNQTCVSKCGPNHIPPGEKIRVIYMTVAFSGLLLVYDYGPVTTALAFSIIYAFLINVISLKTKNKKKKKKKKNKKTTTTTTTTHSTTTKIQNKKK